MFKRIRDFVKDLPILGPWLYHIYLTLFYREGHDETILVGPLKGMMFRRFMHTYWPEFVDGSYEPEIQQVFIELIRPGDVVYDVGANAGFLTLLASKLVGNSGLVVAFEPGPKTSIQLRTQIEINHLKNVIVEESAVSDEIGTSNFVIEATSATASLASVQGTDNGKKLKTRSVKTTTLDHMIGQHKPPALVKIDIEGAELLALSGASRLLHENRPILVVELHSEELSHRFHALMEHYQYQVLKPSGEKAESGDFSRFVVAKPLSA
jgi:FkbM family methyltransferase